MFDNIEHCQLFIQPELYAEDIKRPIDIPGCIINDPETTLAIPLVDLNPQIIVNSLIENSKVKPDSRTKPVSTTVKGSGNIIIITTKTFVK